MQGLRKVTPNGSVIQGFKKVKRPKLDAESSRQTSPVLSTGDVPNAVYSAVTDVSFSFFTSFYMWIDSFLQRKIGSNDIQILTLVVTPEFKKNIMIMLTHDSHWLQKKDQCFS